MKLFLTMLVLQVVLLAVYAPAVRPAEPADTKHLPPPCASVQLKPPQVAYCPEPYIRMVPVKPDDMFSSAWYCRTNDYTMVAIKSGSGCGGGGFDMVDGKWALPRKPPPSEEVEPRGSDIQRHSTVVPWDSLEYSHTYQLLGERTPLMKGMMVESLEDLRHVVLPAGTVIEVEEITRRGAFFFYHVSLPNNAGLEGWINSVALINDGVLLLSGVAPRIDSPGASETSIDYRSEIIDAVMDPCILAIYKRMGGVFDTLTDSEILGFAKLSMSPGQLEAMIEDLILNVTGESLEVRNVLYGYGKQICIDAGIP